MSRRDTVCVPPKYPGRSEDYIYVEEHCRRKTKRNDLKRKALLVRLAKAASKEAQNTRQLLPTNTRHGLALDILYKTMNLYPEHLVFLVRGMKKPSNVARFPDPEIRYDVVRESWKKMNIPNSARQKLAVFELCFL